MVLEPLNFELNKSRGLFLTAILRKQLQQFGYTNTVSAQKLKELKLRLPYKIYKNKEQLDCIYMENYIKTLEAYLTVTGLKDYHLTKNDEKILDTFAKLSDTESRVFGYIVVIASFHESTLSIYTSRTPFEER